MIWGLKLMKGWVIAMQISGYSSAAMLAYRSSGMKQKAGTVKMQDFSQMVQNTSAQNVLKPIDFVATLLEGKVKYQKLPSGNSDYIEFYDKNGEMVTTYSNNGWTMYTTNAEAARQTEMCMIYNEAWGNAKRGIPMAGEEMVNVVDMQSSFDAKA